MERLEALYHLVVRRPGTPGWFARTLMAGALLAREMIRDQLHVRSATLAYWSLVAIVPVLVLVVAVLEPLGGGLSEPIRRLLYGALLVPSVRDVGATIEGWLSAVDIAKLGVVGLLGVAFTASRIYFSMEEAYNRLWNVRVRRSLLHRLVIFYTGVTFGPLLLAFGFAMTARITSAVGATWISHLLPTLLTSAAFVGAIKTLPDTRVNWVPALVGGLVSGAVFEIVKIGFTLYTRVLGAEDSASAIYGSLGLLPIFLVWLYVLWFVVLSGVEVAFVVQRLPDLMAAEERLLAGPDDTRHHADALFALQVLLVVVRSWAEGQGPAPEPTVTHALKSEPLHVRQALDTLESTGVLAQSAGAWIPALPPDRVTVRDVIRRYRALTRPAMGEDAPGADAIEDLLSAPGGRLDATIAELAADR